MPDFIIPLKLLFLLGFTLHNLEEALWLPKWSKYAEKFHKPVERDEFIFAVILITVIGYLLTLIDLIYGEPGNAANYIYLGFIGMMGLNSIFPHLLSTVVIKKYAPGLMTGIFLNLPISVFIISVYVREGINIFYLLLSIIIVSAVTLSSLKFQFRLGKKLIRF